MRFKMIRMLEMFASGLIPILAGFYPNPLYIALLGFFVFILQSTQVTFQFQENWIKYRNSAEGLKHEKFLWQARAGPYRDPESPYPTALFAERVEALISTEHAKWVSYQEQAGKGKEQSN